MTWAAAAPYIASGVGAIAGGLMGGGSDPEAVSAIDALPRDFRASLDWGRDFAVNDIWQGGAAADGGHGVPPDQYYPGQTYAPINDQMRQGLGSQVNFANNQLPGLLNQQFDSYGNALNANQTLQNNPLFAPGMQQFQNAGNMYNDPSVQAGLDTISSRANRNFGENILPQLRQQATGTGNQYSSKAEQSERLAGRDLQGLISDAQGSFLGGQLASARGLQGNLYGTMGGVSNAGTSLQGNTIANSPNVLQTGLLQGQTQYGAGLPYQNEGQNYINEQMNRYNFNQAAPDAQLDQYLNRVLGLAGGGGNFAFQPQSASTNPVAGALGGAILGSQAYNAISPHFTNPASGSGTNPSQMGITGSTNFGSGFNWNYNPSQSFTNF